MLKILRDVSREEFVSETPHILYPAVSPHGWPIRTLTEYLGIKGFLELSFQIEHIERFYFQHISVSKDNCPLFFVLWGARHVPFPVRDPEAENDASEPQE